MSRLRLLFAASEMAPLVKTGGLADVAGGLTSALRSLDCDVRVVLPAYGDLLARVDTPHSIARTRLGRYDVEVLETNVPQGQRIWLVACAELFGRNGNPYLAGDGRDWPDNADRFALFSLAIAWLARPTNLRFHADVVHLNDWQTGLAAAWLRREANPTPSVFSIHNLAYQGNFDRATFERLGLPAEFWSFDGIEFHDSMSCMKSGIAFADRLTTVSPSYAREIQTPEYGCGFDGLIRHRATVLHGIVNGIDSTVWNPSIDPLLRARYSETTLERKLINKRALQGSLDLDASDVPLLGVVSRLVHQKGIDLILSLIDSLESLPAQLVVLGNGEAAIEAALHAAGRRHAGRVAYVSQHDERLAHQIEAGADIFLMPSRYEPCGLNQMYSQTYGTVPVVRRTGGLIDTVDAVMGRDGTGFFFESATPDALLDAIRRAVEAYHDRHRWRAIQRNGMARDFSWRASALRYLDLYESLIGNRQPVSQ